MDLIFQLASVTGDKSNAEDRLKATEVKLELVTAKVNEVTEKYDNASTELKKLSETSALQIKTGMVEVVHCHVIRSNVAKHIGNI